MVKKLIAEGVKEGVSLLGKAKKEGEQIAVSARNLFRSLVPDNPSISEESLALHNAVERGVTQGRSKKEVYNEIGKQTGLTNTEINANEKIFSRLSGGGSSDNIIDEVRLVARALTTEPTSLQAAAKEVAGGKGTKSTRITREKTGKAAIGAGVLGYLLGELDLPPEKASEFEQAFSKAFNAGEETFIFEDKEYSTEVKKGKAMGGMMYNKGSLLKMPYAEGGEADEGSDVEDKPSYSAGKKEETGGKESSVDPMSGVKTSMDLMSEPGGRGNRAELALDTVANVGKRAVGKLGATGVNVINNALKTVDKIPGGMDALAYSLMIGPAGAKLGFGLEALDRIKNNKNTGGRVTKQEGSLMVPPEMESDMPEDTYPNIPPEEMAEAEASQLPDAEMEDKYMDFVLDQSLDDEEQSYLMNALETDPKLSQIFDKVITTASEFTGSGEVEGPGTGVSDSIPARLSDGEFVFTKKATDQMGSDNLQEMMDDAERAYDGGMMRSPKKEGGMLMYKQKDENPLDYEKIAQDEIKKNMLRANRAPSLLGGN